MLNSNRLSIAHALPTATRGVIQNEKSFCVNAAGDAPSPNTSGVCLLLRAIETRY